MARAIWSGSISFGLVNIPVKLFNAVSRKGVSFNQIDSRSGSRVKMQRVSAADGTEVPYEAIVKGYELSPDRYVLIEPEELDSLDPEATHTIEIEEFVSLADIDPIFYDAPYYVAPVKGTEKSYALLARAMEEENKVAMARFVMRTKQYLAALRPKDGKLLISTMVYADEIIPAEEISELDGVDEIDVSDRELTMAKQLIDSLSSAFNPEQFRDTYRDKVLELIERKAEGVETIIAAPTAVEETKVVDLLAALEASVKDAREARKRHPAAVDAEDEADAEAAKPKKRAKKSA
ncbi:MAG: end-binding protein Ku [Actinomycetota bacterium]|nr:end-binding protein Ku [Actinomycetota bacterium]